MQNSQQKGTVKMAEKIASINQVVNGFIWGVPAMICIIGVGKQGSIQHVRARGARPTPEPYKSTLSNYK